MVEFYRKEKWREGKPHELEQPSVKGHGERSREDQGISINSLQVSAELRESLEVCMHSAALTGTTDSNLSALSFEPDDGDIMPILALVSHYEHQCAKSPEESNCTETSNPCISQR